MQYTDEEVEFYAEHFKNWFYKIEQICWDDLLENDGNGHGMSLECQDQFRMTIMQCDVMEGNYDTTFPACDRMRWQIECVQDLDPDVGVCADLLGRRLL